MSSNEISLTEISQVLGVDKQRRRHVSLGELREEDPQTASVEVSILSEDTHAEDEEYEVIVRKVSPSE